MKKYTLDILGATSGLPLAGSVVTLFLTGTQIPVALYTSNSVIGPTHLNPFTSDAGVEEFYVPDGTYDILVQRSGRTTLVRDQEIYDFSDFVTPSKGDKGDPGGNVMAAGPFSVLSAGGTAIPAGTTLIRTSSYTAGSMRGSARYVYDPAVNAAFVTANPRTSFLSSDTRGFRLDPDQIPCATAFGCTIGLGNTAAQTNNTLALQEALWWVADYGAALQLPKGIIYPLPGVSIYPFRYGQNGTSRVLGCGYLDCGIFWNTNDTHTNWCVRMPEDYLTWDNKRVHTGGDLAADNTTVAPTGRVMNWSGFTLSSGYGKYGQGLFCYNVGNSKFDGMCFDSAYRGCYASGFNITFDNPRLTGTYSNRSGANAAVYLADMDNAFGLFFTNHTTVNNASAVGCGTAIWANGGGGGVYSARLEVNAIGVKLGGSNLNFDTWNGTIFTGGSLAFGGTMEDVTTESNFVNWDCQQTTGARILNCGSTGFTGGVAGPGGRNYGKTGVIVRSGVRNDTIFENFSDGVSGYDDGFIMQGTPTIIGAGSPRLSGESSPFSVAASAISLKRYVANRRLNDGLTARQRTTSYESQMVVRGLTELDIKSANAFSNNLGNTQLCATGDTATAVAFMGGLTGGEAAYGSFPAGVADGASTLATGTYAYASTIVGIGGETGITWEVNKPYAADNNFRSVAIMAGQRASMAFYGIPGGGARFKRRIYRFDTVNNRFQGYWEFPATQGTFNDIGQAFDGEGVPPPQGSQIMAKSEPDAAYQVLITPSWATPYYVAAADKLTTGFTARFVTAAPAGASFDWMLLRGKS
jgi:hypothetical protein